MTTAYDVTGDLRQCTTCRAPYVSPFPVDWTLELIKEGPATGPVRSYLTPHRPTCTAPPADPRPGIACRISGAFVVETDLGFPGFHRCDCGQVFDSHEALVDHRAGALAALAASTAPRPEET